jgi:hypothetical protein
MKNLILKIFAFFSTKEKMKQIKRTHGEDVIPKGKTCNGCPYIEYRSAREEDAWDNENIAPFCWFKEKETNATNEKICGE